MQFEFATKDLEELYYEEKGASQYLEDVVSAFFRRMKVIGDAKDERDLRALQSVHFEKLKPKHAGLYSLRLCGRWRLIFTFAPASEKDKKLVIKEISNHYGD